MSVSYSPPSPGFFAGGSYGNGAWATGQVWSTVTGAGPGVPQADRL